MVTKTGEMSAFYPLFRCFRVDPQSDFLVIFLLLEFSGVSGSVGPFPPHKFFSNQEKGVFRRGFCKHVCLSWLWRSECQMQLQAFGTLVFLGMTLDHAETPFAKTPLSWKQGKDPHPQDKIQHLDFTKDPRPLYYKTPPCAFTTKMSVVRPFSVLSKDEIGP